MEEKKKSGKVWTQEKKEGTKGSEGRHNTLEM